ncbi:MAG: MarR family winged helix-turn-helix transcriptional regulator [Desulfovibrionaceae bacterium]
MFFLKELPTRRILEAYRERFPSMDVDAVGGALALLRRASVLLRRLDVYFAERGLSQLRFVILIVLDRESAVAPEDFEDLEHPGNIENREHPGLNMGDIAERVDVSRPVLTRTVSAMEESGLVACRPSEEDARVRLVRLTDAGREALRGVLPGYYELLDAAMREGRGGGDHDSPGS